MADSGANLPATAASNHILPAISNTAKDPGSAAPIRRRNRVIASCLECRRRKLKCDKTQPSCANCNKFRRECRYIGTTLDHATQQRISDFKEQIGSLEQVLERNVAKSAAKPKYRRPRVAAESSDDDENSDQDEADNLEPSLMTSLDQVYDDDADDDLMDLGIQIGKMRVSERIGGFVRPKFAEELQATIPQQRPQQSYSDESQNVPMQGMGMPMAGQNDHWRATNDSYMLPGPDYIAPSSNFFLSAQPTASLLSYLPSRATCDQLLDRYWSHCHPIVTVVHKPSFKLQYNFFWQNYLVGQEPPASTQSVVAAALFLAVVSLDEGAVFGDQAWDRNTLLDHLKIGVESSLARANFLRTTKLQTMQAFVMYLLALCRSEVSRSHSALTGTAIRLAMCMGLHRDGTIFGFSPLETHVRRLVWYQLCFLDIRTAEAVGPRPQIRREDFDTKLPLNVNEDDFLAPEPPTEDLPYFTDMTVSRLKFECMEGHRMVWVEQPRLQAKKTKAGVMIERIEKWQKDLEARYFGLLGGSDPRMALGMCIYRILASRLYTMSLQSFVVGVPVDPPEKIQRTLLNAVLVTNEHTMSFDTHKNFTQWAWYRGAFLQYHSALILLFVIGRDPACTEGPRIWKVLDYVFELPPHMGAAQKADSIMAVLKARMEEWQSVRKARVPQRTEEALAVLRQSRMGQNNPEVVDAWQSSMRMQYGQSMDPSRFDLPPLYSDSSSQQVLTGAQPSPQSSGFEEQQSSVEPQLQQQQHQPPPQMSYEDLWADWSTMPPVSAPPVPPNMIPDLNLGSWTPFVSKGHDPWERSRRK